jgi:molybdenum cofactor cytidylyltransferase
MPTAVVPAAGSARRFGGGKLFALIDGDPLLDRTLSSLLDGGVSEIVVVVPPEPGWGGAAARLQDPRVRLVVNPDPSRGMFSSIQIGLRAVADQGPVAILPGDMPFVRAETVRAVCERASHESGIVSPRLGGRRGHPVVVPFDVRGEILAASPTARLNEVLRRHEDRFVNIDVSDRGVVRDVDVKSDLAPAEGKPVAS